MKSKGWQWPACNSEMPGICLGLFQASYDPRQTVTLLFLCSFHLGQAVRSGQGQNKEGHRAPIAWLRILLAMCVSHANLLEGHLSSQVLCSQLLIEEMEEVPSKRYNEFVHTKPSPLEDTCPRSNAFCGTDIDQGNLLHVFPLKKPTQVSMSGVIQLIDFLQWGIITFYIVCKKPEYTLQLFQIVFESSVNRTYYGINLCVTSSPNMYLSMQIVI